MTQAVSRDDVLDGFAAEPVHDRATLERYLGLYPQFANELLDLVAELRRTYEDEADELSSKDLQRIETAWRAYNATGVESVLSSLSVDRLREVSRTLRVPRQVISGFREGRVILSTVPSGFLRRLAGLIGTTVESLGMTAAAPARSYKSDVKPEVAQAISFEQLLIDAGMTEEQRAKILSDRD